MAAAFRPEAPFAGPPPEAVSSGLPVRDSSFGGFSFIRGLGFRVKDVGLVFWGLGWFYKFSRHEGPKPFRKLTSH